MNWNEYQNEAMRTSGNSTAWDFSLQTGEHPQDNARLAMSMVGMGVAGEAGEVCDYLKKVVHHGHPLDAEKLKKELGDVLWYVAVCAKLAGFDLDAVAKANILKLRQRYPSGFDSAASQNRVSGDS